MAGRALTPSLSTLRPDRPMLRARIRATGMAVPDRVVTNHDLAAVMDTSDDWIRTRTGIAERRWVREGETGAALALAASRRALEAAGMGPKELDAIVYATSSPDHFAPGNGVYLQDQLGAGPIPALDVRTQCSGFVFALAVADAWIRSGMYARILVVGCEVQSTGMDVSTAGRNTAVIFADGAGAVVVERTGEDRGILALDLHGDGANADKLWVDAPGSMYHPRASVEQIREGRQYLQMDGREVFRHAVVRMPESVRAALATLGQTPSDLRLLIPHQANLRISEAVQKSLGLRDDQVYNNIMRYGNTTAGTIPLAMETAREEGRLKKGDLVLLAAVGAGFTTGATLLRWAY